MTDTVLASLALNSLEDNVAVLDAKGHIVMVNRAWRCFASDNPLPDGGLPCHTDVGTNYLSVCKRASGDNADGANAVYSGLKAILDGKKRIFRHEYPCHSPNKQRWFAMTAKVLGRQAAGHVVVIHSNITAQRAAENDLLQKQNDLAAALAQLQSLAARIRMSFDNEISLGARVAPAGENDLLQGPDNSIDLTKLDVTLSKREIEVMLAIVRGERNLHLAARLGLSTKSISTYRRRVLEKLHLESNAQLIHFVGKAGIR